MISPSLADVNIRHVDNSGKRVEGPEKGAPRQPREYLKQFNRYFLILSSFRVFYFILSGEVVFPDFHFMCPRICVPRFHFI